MNYKVIMKDGTAKYINCANYDNAPNIAWRKFGQEWSVINEND